MRRGVLTACCAAGLLAALPGFARAVAGDPVADALVRAYPQHLARVEKDQLVWKDGARMPLSNGHGPEDYDAMLDHPDIRDMFSIAYPHGPLAREPGANEDPGRIRYEPFFQKMYGDCEKGEVEPRLRPVQWMPHHHGGVLKVTTVNGVADRLEEVVRDLEKLPARMMVDLVPPAGVYNCRAIAGTNRRSMHAYGAAIDISLTHSDYWRWSKKGRYVNRIPYEIVEVFERHGFIWGGKWNHFDTMHFEYRPELAPAA